VNRTHTTPEEEMTSKRAETGGVQRRIGRVMSGARRIAALAFPVASIALGACQPAVHSRQPVEPAWGTATAQMLDAGGGFRLEGGRYSVARLRASVASRQWPLMDAWSVAHRYSFDLASEDGSSRGVECVLITVVGEDRERATLDCRFRGEGSWRVRLAGQRTLAGALTGEGRVYAVRGGDAAAAPLSLAYRVLATDTTVAHIPVDRAAEAWIAPELSDSDRAAVAATVAALVVGRDLRGGAL
jgi:hypothetical protein